MIRANLALVSFAAFFLVTPAIGLAQQPLPAEGNEEELIATLQSDAELFEKAKACQRLAIIGTSKSVPMLAKLLGDENLSHYARFGLESNPSPNVDVALRDALGKVSGNHLAGVINSIGVRGDEQAVDALIKLANNESELIADAALSTLGAIASPESVDAILSSLSKSDSLRVVAADACLTAADRLLLAGENDQAAKIFKALGKTKLPTHLNVATRFGQIRSGADDVEQLMIDYLSSDDRDLFRIGLELAHQLPSEQATEKLLDSMASMSDSEQVLLLHVLGSRSETSALPAVLDAASSTNAGIQAAAVEVLEYWETYRSFPRYWMLQCQRTMRFAKPPSKALRN